MADEAPRDTQDPLGPTNSLSGDQLREWFAKSRYVYAEEIGRGGMARILCAADLHLCRTVAYKTALDPDSMPDVTRFLFEAQLAGQMEHPSIIPVYDIGLDPETHAPFFTMRMVSGRTLFRIIRGLYEAQPEMARFRRLLDRLTVFLKVCDAVCYAHDHGVIHQDIKPENVMVGDYGEVYLIDWGVARLKAHPPAAPLPRTPSPGPAPQPHVASFLDIHRLAREPGAGSVTGSPSYMAPELFCESPEADERCDVYALGCTLYETLSLRRPFPSGVPITELFELKRDGDFVRVWDHNPEIPKAMGLIVHKCMEPAPEARFATAGDLQDALKELLEVQARQTATVPVPSGFTDRIRQLNPLNVGRVRRELLELLGLDE